jgi:capsular polysaccharide export protein
MTLRILGSLENKNIVLLQGPMGPFFRRLDKAFRAQGARVHRICFNGGDFFFANKDNLHHFTGSPEQWRTCITRFLRHHRIDKVIFYGDCRFYHREALAAASDLGIESYVFEEGYVRPNFITLEKGGVNSYSALPCKAAYYRNQSTLAGNANGTSGVTHAFCKWAFYATAYFVAMRLLSWYYPCYRHHRNNSVLLEAFYGVRNAWRKIGYRVVERGMQARLATELHRKYFFVPLQTIGDSQITTHSPFTDIQDFIGVVLRSFAAYAPQEVKLIIKHHPIDRGRADYSRYIRELAGSLGIGHRVLPVHDVHLPTCLQNAIGTIAINSTVGISSLFHRTPTIVLGKALYDIDGLTCKGMPLDRFWHHCQVPDKHLFHKFRSCLIKRTQLEGSFYSAFPEELNGQMLPGGQKHTRAHGQQRRNVLRILTQS